MLENLLSLGCKLATIGGFLWNVAKDLYRLHRERKTRRTAREEGDENTSENKKGWGGRPSLNNKHRAARTLTAGIAGHPHYTPLPRPQVFAMRPADSGQKAAFCVQRRERIGCRRGAVSPLQMTRPGVSSMSPIVLVCLPADCSED